MVVPRRTTRATRTRRNVSYDVATQLSEDESTRDLNTNDSDTYDDDDHEDENDEVYSSRKRAKSGTGSRRKRTLARQNQKRRQQHQMSGSKPLASNVDEIEDYEENPIFQSLSNGEYNPSELAKSWFDDFITDDVNTKFEALKDFLNFILRCSGCIVQLSRHDVTNTENAKETVNEIQAMFARQKYHEFPMVYTAIGNNSDWKEFPSNALTFLSSIVIIASESGVLYEEDDQFIELLLEWIGSMSTSNIRALRYVATIFGLNIQSVLCKLSVNISKFIDKFLRQLKKENDSLKNLIKSDKMKTNRQLKRQVDSANERIKVVEDNLEMYKRQKKLIDNYIGDFFNILFAHRYRDVSNEIRLKCVCYLGEWMEEYPELFTESFYLRYLGWLLTDQDANIRSEVFKVLIKLYKKRNTISSLIQFTSYFKHKLIEIVIYETDFNARYNCLQLLNEVIEKGYLVEDDMIKITSLIFIDDEDLVYPFQGSKLNPGKFLKEIAKFISKVEENVTSELIEQNELDLEKINDVLPFDSKSLLKLKSLMKIISDSQEYYLSAYSKSAIKINQYNSRIEKFSKVFQNLYSLKRYNESNAIYDVALSYLTFDFSSITNEEITHDITAKLEVDSKIQLNLMYLINASTRIYIDGVNNQFYKLLFPHHRSKQAVENERDAAFYISKLLSKIADITSYFHDDIEQISVLINTVYYLMHNKSSSALKMNESNINGLKKTIEEFYRLFPVINFPLCPQKCDYSVKYYDTITYQFSELLKVVNNVEFDLNSSVDATFNETSIMVTTKLENRDASIIDSINKLHILANSTSLTANATGKLSTVLPLYAESLQKVICEGADANPPIAIDIPLSELEFHAFLQISSENITDSLHRIFLAKAKGSSEYDVSSTVSAINKIQQYLSHLLDPALFLEKLMSLDNIHRVTSAFIENTFTISAFVAEYSSLPSDSNDFEEIASLRSKISSWVAEKMLKLYCIREYQYASLVGVEDKLERNAEEDVNFSVYQIQERSDESLSIYETFMCDIAAKLILSCRLNIIDDADMMRKVDERIRKNSEIIRNEGELNDVGEMYRRVLESVGILTSTDENADQEAVGNKRKVQKKITEIMNNKRRKLIDEEEGVRSEEEDEDDEHGEDENDPIETSSEEEEEIDEPEEVATPQAQADDSEMVFSDIEEDDKEHRDHSTSGPAGTFSSEISSLASSFPFTQ